MKGAAVSLSASSKALSGEGQKQMLVTWKSSRVSAVFANFLLFFSKQYGLTVYCIYLDLHTPNFFALKGLTQF